ncbi:class II D-tagatose-bisphosphate aldolase, non-catalytic subunit [Tropicimonas sp. TH_r6]|uniref:class II D-tagatose-bisphosphate aldolase, non-catalytic subunit n=1 Tax=Tropicimonas sp. TH_r6 TaxID=3082085 RepID=UPI0029538BE1|nr:class II D-tagatose-bisphosphate aldolase, non-catalytic subunit [Tropicimonas sp. TH_r6]MDV7145349.1 class II D-tagatose-bisphosphate aldolase, non-catalytic subunit [Tropicimonas sp. TH_r6]
MLDIHSMIDANRGGQATGLPCFCTANEQVIRAILDFAAQSGFPTVIEATCNQVNQDGGYTGMQPADFMAWMKGMAGEAGVPMDQLILGGDHLGPNAWRKEPVESAMEKARELVKLYVEAGFTKIHLDASMACGGEPNPSFSQIAERAADLCAVAEKYAPNPEALVYIIGTEVPIPGGETEEPDALDVTSVPRFQDTIDTHRAAFEARGLTDAWSRIVSVVTQPGVDFSHTSIFRFDPPAAAPLCKAIEAAPGLTFEAHSTDYQPTAALRELVENHFFFLKVGPELTFRFREAVYALAGVEALLSPATPSRLAETLAEVMTVKPGDWQDYYAGDAAQVELLKRFSYSDRIRYYWNDAQVAAALKTMLANLAAQPLPETILSQFFFGQEFGNMPKSADALIAGHVEGSVRRYFAACGFEE